MWKFYDMLAKLKSRFRTWLFRPKIDHGTVVLTQRRIFILPTKQGLTLALVLVVMLLGDINYNLGLGYVLTFLLAMMAMMSMLHAFRNLAHLEIRSGRAKEVFCGEIAEFGLHFQNHSKFSRHQLILRGNNGTTISFDVPALQDAEVTFPLPATQRGWLPLEILTLYTEFPLGLFHAWSYLHFDMRCLVYPKPLSHALLPQGNAPDGAGKRSIAGDDDFVGLRNYVPGDALPRIAWKAFAREQGLQVKQFATPAGEELWLDFADAPDRNEEEKLARMARWVLDAEMRGLRYGLRFPDGELPPGNGTAQRNECLRRIALFNLRQHNGSGPQPLSRERERGAKQFPRPFSGEGAGSGKS